jgi:hypothetical protein
VVPVLLALFLVARYSTSFLVPFLADDLLFLQRTATLSFGSIWSPHGVDFSYYRPWSRELHYWTLQHLFGSRELPFHLASFSLWLTALTLYALLLVRIAGDRAAAVAAAAVAALAAWAVPLRWIAGAQDLWLLAWSLASLLAFTRGRSRWATVCFAGALLSKETAAVLPATLMAYAIVVERSTWSHAFRRTAASWMLMAVWAAFHPLLGGRIGHVVPPPPSAWGAPPSWASIAIRTVLSVVNLDEVPKPVVGWPSTLVAAAIETLLLVAIVLVAGSSRDVAGRNAPASRRSPGRVVAFGAIWACAGWTPLLMPSVWWHAYYGLFGALGAWTALGVLLSPRRWLAVACIAALAVTGAARISTESKDLGSAWYLGRAANFMRTTRAFMREHHSTFPPHSRIYVHGIPGSVGLVPDGRTSPALGIWYGDTSLRMLYSTQYRPRAAGDSAGSDYFFAYDSVAGWIEETIPSLPDHATLADRQAHAQAMWIHGSYPLAAAEYAALADSLPGNAGYPFNVGSCYLRMGDSVQAARWYERSARVPGAPAPFALVARKYERWLRARP